MGLGLHGGAVAVVKWLLKQGAILTVTDIKTQQELKSSLDKIKSTKKIKFTALAFVFLAGIIMLSGVFKRSETIAQPQKVEPVAVDNLKQDYQVTQLVNNALNTSFDYTLAWSLLVCLTDRFSCLAAEAPLIFLAIKLLMMASLSASWEVIVSRSCAIVLSLVISSIF